MDQKLKTEIILGFRWTFISKISVVLIQIITLILLSKFLSKSDFGVISLGLAIIGVSQIFIDAGISNAIIAYKDMSSKQLGSLFVVNIVSGIIMFMAIFLLAPFIAIFYEEKRLQSFLYITSISFLLIPLGQQFMVLCQKEMKFRLVSIIEVVARSSGLFLIILMLYGDFGIYSVAYGYLFSSFINSMFFFLYGIRKNKLVLTFTFSQIKEQITFGFYQLGERVISYLNSQIDSFIIGKIAGFNALGIFNMAKQIAIQPVSIISPVISKVSFPAIVRIVDDDLAVRNFYLKLVRYMGSIIVLIYLIIFIYSHEIMLYIFGSEWLEGVTILKLLSVWGIIMSLANPVGNLLMAKKRADLGFIWNVFVLIYLATFLVITSNFGIKYIALGYIIFQLSLIVPAWKLLINKLCKTISLSDFLLNISKPIIVGALIIGIVESIFYFANDMILKIIFGPIVIMILYFLVNFTINKDFITTIKESIFS